MGINPEETDGEIVKKKRRIRVRKTVKKIIRRVRYQKADYTSLDEKTEDTTGLAKATCSIEVNESDREDFEEIELNTIREEGVHDLGSDVHDLGSEDLLVADREPATAAVLKKERKRARKKLYKKARKTVWKACKKSWKYVTLGFRGYSGGMTFNPAETILKNVSGKR